jgi:hypothetical protein
MLYCHIVALLYCDFVVVILFCPVDDFLIVICYVVIL